MMEEFEVQSLWFGARYRLISEKTAVSAAMLAIQVKKEEGSACAFKGALQPVSGERASDGGVRPVHPQRRKGKGSLLLVRKGRPRGHPPDQALRILSVRPAEGSRGAPAQDPAALFLPDHTLDYRTQAALYLNVLTYLSEDEEIYKAYEGQIEAFAVEQLFQSHINSDLAKIYTRMIYPEMVDERIARVLPKLLTPEGSPAIIPICVRWYCATRR